MTYQARLTDGVGPAIAAPAAPAALRRCGAAYTGPFLVPVVAWHLRLHTGQVTSLTPAVPRPSCSAPQRPRRPARSRRSTASAARPACARSRSPGAGGSCGAADERGRRDPGAARRRRRDRVAVRLRSLALPITLQRTVLSWPSCRGLARAAHARDPRPLLDRRGAVGRHRRRIRSATSRACCARTARRRCTTCCCTSGCSSSATARRTRTRCRCCFALLTIPVALCGARTLFGDARRLVRRRAGRAQPVPDVLRAGDADVRAGRAARRSSAATCFAAAFAPRRRALAAGFAASHAAAALHPQLGAVPRRSGSVGRARAALCAAQRRPPRRSCATRLIAYGVIALLYLPWMPTLLFQAAHTGAPWSKPPGLDGSSSALTACSAAGRPRWSCCCCGGAGLVARCCASADAPGARRGRRRRVAIVAARRARDRARAWRSQVSPAWATRYFAVVRRPVRSLLGRAIGLARAGRLGLVALAVLGASLVRPAHGRDRAQERRARRRRARRRPRSRPGDLVVSTHPEQVPVLHYYLPATEAALRDALGSDARPADLRLARRADRLKAARPTPTDEQLVLDAAARRSTLVLVQPIIRTAHAGGARGRPGRAASIQWERVLDRRIRACRATLAVPSFEHRRLPRGVRIGALRALLARARYRRTVRAVRKR